MAVLPVGIARAEIDPLPDALSAAYYAAVRDLQAGKDRGQIAGRLPILAQALGYTDTVSTPSDAYAQKALGVLQKQVGKDFGYRPAGSEEQRRAAIGKA